MNNIKDFFIGFVAMLSLLIMLGSTIIILTYVKNVLFS